MVAPAFFTQGGAWNAADLRQDVDYTTQVAIGGVISGMQATVVSGQVHIQPGRCVIADNNGGLYKGVQAAQSGVIAIGSLAGGATTRTDTVYAYISDPGSGGTAGQMLFGVAAGTTTIPTLPSNFAIPLARATITGSGITVADARPWARPATLESDLYDTGWVSVDTAGGHYGTGVTANFVQIRRVGRQVFLRGNITFAPAGMDGRGGAAHVHIGPSVSGRADKTDGGSLCQLPTQIYSGNIGPSNPPHRFLAIPDGIGQYPRSLDGFQVEVHQGGGAPTTIMEVYTGGLVYIHAAMANNHLGDVVYSSVDIEANGSVNTWFSTSWLID